jgi:RNA 2',3'-cyclic 3'-phosphodiesterase
MPAAGPDAAKPLRLFLAVWPDAATRDAVAAWQRTWDWPPQASLTRADRLHLTLHFLGDVPAHTVPRLALGLRVAFEPFTLELTRAETWPHGVAVLRPDDTPPALERLHTRLADALTQEGLTLDVRPFRAHVTLARRAQGAGAPRQRPRLVWQATRGYTLVRSLPGGQGYEVLERFT